MESTFQKTSFWKKPEGTTGKIFGIGLLAALGWGLFKILPFIITLLQNLITAIILGVGLVLLIWVISDKRFWALAWYMYKSMMRAITSLFIQIDPIGILKSYVESLRANLEKIREQIGNLRGQMEALKNAIKKNEREAKDALLRASEAKARGKIDYVTVEARQVGRLESSNESYQELYTKMELLYRVLTKYETASDVLIQDIENEVDVRSRERKMVLAGHSAMRSAMAILQGQSDKKEMFDQTMEFLAQDYGRKIGEIEEFQRLSQSVIDGIDIENGVCEQKALQLLEQWEKNPSPVLGAAKQNAIGAAYDQGQPLDLDIPRSMPATEEGQPDSSKKTYKDLLG